MAALQLYVSAWHGLIPHASMHPAIAPHRVEVAAATPGCPHLQLFRAGESVCGMNVLLLSAVHRLSMYVSAAALSVLHAAVLLCVPCSGLERQWTRISSPMIPSTHPQPLCQNRRPITVGLHADMPWLQRAAPRPLNVHTDGSGPIPTCATRTHSAVSCRPQAVAYSDLRPACAAVATTQSGCRHCMPQCCAWPQRRWASIWGRSKYNMHAGP